MFGYVTIYTKGLSPAAQDLYQAYYCGLCRTLRQRCGLAGQLSLSFDMTFAALLLSALYETPTGCSRGRCALHPCKSRPRAANPFVDYAADMTAVLAYYNSIDDWQDERRTASLLMARRLRPYLAGVEERWPRQCGQIRSQLAELDRLEADGCQDLDALCNAFGALLGAVLSPRQDMWAPALDRLGRGLGGFIYLMDAYDDLQRDVKSGCFNALAGLAAQLPADDFEERCQALLTQQMALCAQGFTVLPILKSTPEGELLYNTLYSGVWSRYTLLRAAREKRRARKAAPAAITEVEGADAP